MCLVYSFRSLSIIICVWHIPFLRYTSSHVFGIFLLFYAYYHMCLAYSIRFVCIIICVPSIPFIFFEYPKISCVQWQKAQVLVYFCSWIIEEAITRTNSLENIFTIVNPTMGGANTPPDVKILGWKLPYDLPLVKRVFPAKFHCIWSYRVQMHNEQTDRQTDRHSSLYI